MHIACKVSLFGVILVRIFPHSQWIRRDTEYLSVFCPNAGKYGPDNSEYKHFLRSGQLVFQILIFFFLSGFSFTNTSKSQDHRGREGTIFYSTLPFPPTHEHSDIYLQLCMSDDYPVFLIAPLLFTRLLLDEIYRLIGLPFDWLMIQC